VGWKGIQALEEVNKKIEEGRGAATMAVDMESYSLMDSALHPGINLSNYRHCRVERRMEETEVVEWYKYTCDGILVSVIGLIGIIGNICAVLVLVRPKLKDCFHQLLIALAFFDTLYIICGGINYTFRAFEEVVPFDSA